MYCHRKFQV